jgi:hypothetical protein
MAWEGLWIRYVGPLITTLKNPYLAMEKSKN